MSRFFSVAYLTVILISPKLPWWFRMALRSEQRQTSRPPCNGTRPPPNRAPELLPLKMGGRKTHSGKGAPSDRSKRDKAMEFSDSRLWES